jgi:hypothetical protein
VVDAVTEAWMQGFSTRSNYARENAEAVACAAGEGYITTRYEDGHYGTTWRCTARGMHILHKDSR